MIDGDDIIGKYTLRPQGSQLLLGRAEIKNKNLLPSLHCSQLCVLYLERGRVQCRVWKTSNAV